MKYPWRADFRPMTQKEHKAEDCSLGMSREICMGRCYEGSPGHLFMKGEHAPCDCGTYPNLAAANAALGDVK